METGRDTISEEEELEIKLQLAKVKYEGDFYLTRNRDGEEIRKKTKPETKYANQLMAEYLSRKLILLYDPLNKILKVYGEKNYYEDIGEYIVKSKIQTLIGKHCTRYNQEEILNKLKNMAIKTTEIKPQSLNLLPFKNGVLDINTMKIREHSSQDYFEYQVPFDYDITAECPAIDAFITEVIEPELAELIYDLGGLILYRENYLEKIFIFLGKGSNGKTVIIRIFEHAVGVENCSAVTLKQLCTERFAKASTHKKLLNSGSDIGGQPIYDASPLRALSSKDTISAEFKFGDMFNFTPSATEVFSANTPPIFIEDTDGMYRRLETINFPNNYGNAEDLKEHPEWKPADPMILEKLTKEDELMGFIRKSVEHLKRIIEKKQLSVVRSTDTLRHKYLRASDSLKVFLEEQCIEAMYVPSDYLKISREYIPAQNYILKSEFYTKYKHWCEENKLICFSANRVGRRIKGYGFGIETGKEGKDTGKEESYRGIVWKTILVNDDALEKVDEETICR